MCVESDNLNLGPDMGLFLILSWGGIIITPPNIGVLLH